MEPSSKPPLCDVIYVYCKAALPAVQNQEEVERSVLAYVLSMQQQQASDDEIYEGLNKMCNEIGCPLNLTRIKYSLLRIQVVQMQLHSGSFLLRM